MGYTHYWTLSRPIETEEMAPLADDVRKIVALSGISVAYEYDEPTRPPQIDECAICLNGIGDDGHETFYIKAGKSGLTNEPGMAGFAFCKTARKPYDVIVAASLLALKHWLGNAVSLSSDGNIEDWQAGHDLAQRALDYIVPSAAWALDR